MAITLTVGNSGGIDVAAYLADFNTNFTRNGFGYFSDSEFSGDQYAATEQPNLIPNPAHRSVVFYSAGGNFEYNLATHVVSGTVGGVSFGYGLTQSGGSFQQSLTDLQITGLSSSASSVLGDVIAGNISTLLNLIATNELNFVGGAGADTFAGFGLDDTLAGNGGNDTLTGNGGNDTFVYDGQGADTITDFNGGVGTGDIIRVMGVYTTFAEIQAHTTLVNGNADTQIDFGGGNVLTLTGFNGTLAEDDFEFDTVVPPPVGPEVAVSGNSVDIADGDTGPDAGDGTAFGTHLVNTPVERTFTVTNEGTEPLKLSGLKLPKAFTLAKGEKLEATLQPGQSDTFKVVLDTKKVGTYAGAITFKTNDTDEAAFDFWISATVVEPEIDVKGNGISIKDGAKKALATDHTLFGTGIGLGDTPPVRTFTISNAAGAADLTIVQLVLSGTGFTLLTDLTGTVLQGGQSVTFDVAIDTSFTGTRTSTIAILNDDANESTYDFVVTGTVGPRNVFGNDGGSDVLVATNDPERFVGLGGNDTVSYLNAGGAVVASLLPASQKKNGGFALGDIYETIENLTGSAFNDTLTGDTGNNVLHGGAGADKLDGGTGIDTASYAMAGAGVVVDMLKVANNLGDAQGDTYKNIENLLGSVFADTLGGDTKANAISGSDGNDTLIGNGGIDTLTGGADADTFRFNAAKDGGGATGDIITDFVSGEDLIGISRTGFKILAGVDLGAGGALDFAAHYFVSAVGDPATTANPSGVTATETGHGQFLFNETTNQLWWDEDGSGSKKALLLATFDNGAHVLATDFDLL